jgi:hypothetical protein
MLLTNKRLSTTRERDGKEAEQQPKARSREEGVFCFDDKAVYAV